MPLKVVRRKGSSSFYIRGTVRGQKVFESAETTDRAQAEGYAIRRQSEVWERGVHGTAAVVTFAEAVDSYLDREQRAFTTRRALTKLVQHFGKTPIAKIDQTALDGAYKALLGSKVVNATKARHVRTPLMAVLEHAARRGWCARPAFEELSIAKTRTVFKTPAEVDALIQGAADHAKPLFTFMVGTGVRPSEAFELQWGAVDLRGARCVVEQKQGTFRHIDLPPRVVAALATLPHRAGAVFRTDDGQPYSTGETSSGKGEASGQASKAFATAARRAGWPGDWRVWTPKGARKPKREWVSQETPYVLRHTWASWHYCVHKDLLRLRGDGGWSTIEMVTHYAKAMPDAYRDDIIAWLAGAPMLVEKTA